MQSFEHLDQHFKGLNTYSSPVAPHAFETIMMKRAKRKKPFLFWLKNNSLGIAGAICILGLSYFTFLKNKENSSLVATESVSVNSNTPNQNTDNDPEKIVAASIPVLLSKKVETKITAFKANKLNTELENEVTNSSVTDIPLVSDISKVDEKVSTINIIPENTLAIATEPTVPVRKLMILDKLKLNTSLLNQTLMPKLKLGINDKCPSFSSGSDKTWYVDAWVSPDYASRSLKARSNNIETEQLATSRNTNEKFQFAGSGGIKASLVMKSGLSLRLGFMYSHIWEYFDFKNPSETQVTRTVVHDTLIEVLPGGGTKITITDRTVILTLNGERIVKYNNYYKMYDIPLQVGYEFGRDKSQRYSVNLGMNINISTAYRGKTIDENVKPVEFTTGTSRAADFYQNSVGLSFYASVAMYKRINDRWQFVAEPNMRYMLGSLTKDTYELSHRYTTFGLNLGLRYKIN
jgi:hypothetical protein